MFPKQLTKKNMISINNYGWRLGNNLFQLSAAYGVAKKNNDQVAFPSWKYAHVFEGDFTPSSSSINSIFKEPGFHYTEIPYTPNMAVDGYYQSERYFKHVEGNIKAMFEPKDEIRHELWNRHSRFLEHPKTCSIHVRRGDYLNYPENHPFPGMNYYMKGIKRMGMDSLFLIFSDDTEWCKENFPKLDNFIVIEGQKDYEDFLMMTFCKNHIIGNSSFSWWGAWLCNNQEKIVVAPKRWFGPAYASWDTSDLYPSNWETF